MTLARPSTSLTTVDGGGRLSFARISDVMQIPNLIQVQRDSFRWFQEEGLKELFAEISPIQDFTGRNLELTFESYRFDEPKCSEQECRERDMTYAAPLRVKARLHIKQTGEIKEQDIFMGDFPLMTANGTFIINGAERVVVSQLVRSPGVYFTVEEDPSSGRALCMGKLIPNRGAWLEFETSNRDVLSVKVDRKRKIPVTTLLRAIGFGGDEALVELYREVDTDQEHQFIPTTIEKDVARSTEDALLEFYRRLRPGDPPNPENARNLLNSLFFNFRRYDLGRVGRYKLNRRLSLDIAMTERVLTPQDLTEIVKRMIQINNGQGRPDDIDHLGNRRVRAVGELIQNQFRVGLLRMERVVKERMTIQEAEQATPAGLINIRPVVAAMREFFGGSQLSQFMDQTNPLAELTHKRRLSALGPGGLSRDRAGFEVRDVHHSHYGRICPIETPEGPNIGLIGSLATYGQINQFGFIDTPYRKVYRRVPNQPSSATGRYVRQRVTDPVTNAVIAEPGTLIDAKLADTLAKLPAQEVDVRPFVSDEIQRLTADEEDLYTVAQANVQLNPDGTFVDERISVRHGEKFLLEVPERIDFVDVSPKQTVSVATALIPFLEHDDANRALMGSNMQRQAVPLLQPEAPLVGTGMEAQSAQDSGQVTLARTDGVVESSTAREVVVVDPEGNRHSYPLIKFLRSNQGTCLNQRPIVVRGQRVKAGQALADSSSTQRGELALGQNVLVAFMSWEGYNFEDAIILSETIVREDKFTSIHIEKHEIEARDTKLGPEEITRDIPNVGEDSLRDLDEYGIIRVGAEVGPGDILVGKITPKGETELTAEERLLRAIFGEKAREVKDTSLRVPHGERGKVVDVRVFERGSHDELPAGVNKLVRVSIAQKRKISEGDKMAGRHGNKGVISKILPIEDMPYLPDGTPIEIILNPIGVPSRMNVGQILETHLGWAASVLGIKVATPVFDGASEGDIRALLEKAGLPTSGKITMYDGRTGEPFEQPVTVGQIYMLKLVHLVEDKIHARSTGPYSLITQQPLGGKAQFGGQRFGEMEVWALEAYGAAHILQEILTVKSDDVVGRVKTYEAIVKGDQIFEAGVPESFKVLVKELQSLGLAVEILNEEDENIPLLEDATVDATHVMDVDISRLER
ncbi:MAG: DNA-directed RNA polymerase subunit beta [Chloroflexi bacterium]|nr:DNA-directed RNA polymerase subunit beta [Chloroflexota bacterium]